MKNKKKYSAFTLIELMAVVVIIGVLAAIAIANFQSAQLRAKLANTKTNMNLFQTMSVLYSVDYASFYPSNVTELETDAKNKKYWKDFKNAFNDSTGKGLSYDDISATPTTGVVYYEPSGTPISKYYIYSGDITNGLFMKDSDSTTNFFLSNN